MLKDKKIEITVLLATLLVKVVCYFLFIHGASKNITFSSFFIQSPDHGEYVQPIDNFIEYGNYSLSPTGEPYAGRLPGFVFPYIVFRFFFSESASNFLLGLFMLAFSLYVMYLLANRLRQMQIHYLLIFGAIIGLEVLPYYWSWNWTLHPMWLSGACVIAAICFLLKWMDSGNTRHLAVAGFYLAWLFMMRGYTFLFMPFVGVVLCVKWYRAKEAFSKLVAQVLIFTTPFLVFETAWIIRNYVSLARFIPLQTAFVPGGNNQYSEYGYYSATKYSMMELRKLIDCWGGDNFWYFKGADMKWFMDSADATPAKAQFKQVVLDAIPDSMLTRLKHDVLYSYSIKLTTSAHDSIEALIVSKSHLLREQFLSKAKLYHVFVAPANRIKNLVLKNPVQDWPGPSFANSSLLQKLIRLASLTLYAITLLLFVVLSLLKFRAILNNERWLLLFLMSIAIPVTFGWFVNTTHFCYLIPSYVSAFTLNLFILAHVFRESRTRRVS